MRIISGIARGRRIDAPEGLNTRPTSDRVKESMFNIIQKKIFDKAVLDLFAGTGNLGLEALSRGAVSCIFIERDKNTFGILKNNIKSLGFEKMCEVYNQDAFVALNLLGKRGISFDLIFLDPPYGKGMIEKALEIINTGMLLKDGGLIVSEYDEKDIMPEKIGSIHIYRTEKYGRTRLAFWILEE
jgi:16S rRNA (guanine966-N2)-methyltransferase